MSVRASLCLCVTRRYSVQTNKRIFKIFLPHHFSFIVPSGTAILRRKRGRRIKGVQKTRFPANISLYLETSTRYSHSYYGMRIGNRTQLSNGTVFNELQCPVTQISMSHHYLTLIISETVRDTDIVTMEY